MKVATVASAGASRLHHPVLLLILKLVLWLLLVLLADEPPETDIKQLPFPQGQSAVGWGLWEFYEVEGGKWFREIVADYDPDEQEYLASTARGDKYCLMHA